MRWAATATIVVALFIVAGQVVSAATRNVDRDVRRNTDALITLCATIDTFAFVFEQLQSTDRQLARDRSLPRSVRRELAFRSEVYRTAIDALSDQDAQCEQIE